ncbi:MAG: hypothetical protein H6926_05700 [Chromatiales bacterium]|nr:hypothetical protein [Gammaproteobacteria bacterium]MCP5352663.1 hypothetical protein [Chromatiales bacterium]
MYFDNFTLGAIAIFVIVLLVFFGLHKAQQSETREQLEALERRLHDLHSVQPAASREAREMCAAIHHLHPGAVVGEHFQIADDGNGPYISAWYMDAPQPSPRELADIVEGHREEWSVRGYREARLAEYPSIGDQLDALYKARHGDDSDLRTIDARIAEIKADHPNIDRC